MNDDHHASDSQSFERAMISFVVPCYNEQDVLPMLYERLRALAEQLEKESECDAEFVLVDDGSEDGTWRQICSYRDRDDRFQGVRLSRNFGQQAAVTCGYAFSRGDAVVCLDADLQDPPEVVPEMVARWRSGFDIVYGVRRRRRGETAWKRGTATFFYWLVRRLGIRHIRTEVGDFRLMSQLSVQTLLAMPERDRFLRGMVGWIGFAATEVFFDRAPRAAGRTKWPLRNMLRLAGDAIVSFSRAPLRLAYGAAATLTLGLAAYIGYLLAAHLRWQQPAEPSRLALLLTVAAFGLSNLLCLAVTGEYIARIHEQSRGRPLYIVRETTGPRERETKARIRAAADHGKCTLEA